VERDFDPPRGDSAHGEHDQHTGHPSKEERSWPKHEHDSEQYRQSNDSDREEQWSFRTIGCVYVGPGTPANLTRHERGNGQERYQSDEEQSPESFARGAEAQRSAQHHDDGHDKGMAED
jgi:hypothetical protein